MAKFLTTSGISYEIENIIKGARKKLILISPYLQLSENFYERLQDADNLKISITIIFGKSELDENEVEKLKNLNNVKLYFHPYLHAKCYFNEARMIITSMNMYDYSEKRNREMGVLIDRKEDSILFSETVKEAESIKNASQKYLIKEFSSSDTWGWESESEYESGHCIRCDTSIPYNSGRPYCWNCYKVWVEYENPFYEEEYCHRCGKEGPATMDKPLCSDCYKVAVFG